MSWPTLTNGIELVSTVCACAEFHNILEIADGILLVSGFLSAFCPRWMQNDIVWIIGGVSTYVGGSSKLHTLCHMTQVQLKSRATAMKRVSGLLKLVFFTYKGAGILQTSLYITQRVLATPNLIGT